MNSKERMLRALARERPDRLPATLHQWQPYHLKYFMDGMSDLEAFRATGLDAALLFWPPFETEDTPQWKTSCRESRNERGETVCEHEIVTPDGTLSYRMTSNEMTGWLDTHPITRDEDIYLIKNYMPIPRLPRQRLAEAYDELGDDGIMRGIVPAFNYQGGPWQEAVEWYGMENLLMAAYTKPDWVHEFLRILLDKKLEFIDREMRGAKYDLIETGGGAGSCTVVSPQIFETFLVPYDRELHDALHATGHKVVYHTCGGMMRILDLIPQNHCDASETLTPLAMGGNIEEPRIVKERLGPHVCLIGGLDQNNVLKLQDEAGIRAEVKRLFMTYGEGGGYMISPSDHFFDVGRDKLEMYARAARECVYD